MTVVEFPPKGGPEALADSLNKAKPRPRRRRPDPPDEPPRQPPTDPPDDDGGGWF